MKLEIRAPRRSPGRVAVALLACAGALCAQTDRLFLSDGDGDRILGIQGGMVAVNFPAVPPIRAFPIAIVDTIRITGYAPGEIGGEYSLAGAATGTQYPLLQGNLMSDGCTDGATYNYGISFQGAVWRYDRTWNAGVLRFNAASHAGITYDLSDDTLWLSRDRAAGISHYDLNGMLLGSFTTVGNLDWIMALEPSTDTLWVSTRFTQQLVQYSKTGTLLQTVSVSGMSPSSFFSGEFQSAGPRCTPVAPAGGAMVSGLVAVSFDVAHTMAGQTVSALVEASTDMGVSWTPCTPSAGTNPITGLMPPAAGVAFTWDSVADAVGLIAPATASLRITLDDGMRTGSCGVTGLIVDNVIPPPICMLALTGSSPVGNDVGFSLTATSSSAAAMNVLFEASTDSGVTFFSVTPAPGFANPLVGVASGAPAAFAWGSRTDMVGLASIAPGVSMRATADDAVSPVTGSCTAGPFDVDNTALCPGVCGDCDVNAAGPNILDALTAAQLAAGLVAPTVPQTGCCDVDSSSLITILDALQIAQLAAGLPIAVACP